MTEALTRLHAMLSPEQRAHLSAIVRTDPFLLQRTHLVTPAA